MADYYSILKKTIASLPESNGAARRSVYSRARNAIVNQLKAYEPPLSPSEITAEQLRLEEAIRKVEAEAARASLGLEPPPSTAPATPAAPATPPSEPLAVSASASVSEPSVPVSAPTEPAVVAHEPAGIQAEAPASPPVQSQVADVPAPSDEVPAATAADASVAEAAPVSSAYAAPEDLEPPQHQSAFEEVAPEPESTALFEDEDAALETATAGLTEPGMDARKSRVKLSASEALQGGEGKSRLVPIAAAAAAVILILGGAAYFLLPGPSGDTSTETSVSEPKEQQTAVVTETTPEPEKPEVPAVQPVGETPAPQDDADAGKNTDRLLNENEDDFVASDARSVTTTTINPQPAAPVTPSQPSIVTNVESSPSAEQPASEGGPVAVVGDPVPQDSLAAVTPPQVEQQPSAEAADTGAQRSILYEEGADASAAGTAAQGAVIWTLGEETGLGGQAQSVLSASVEIPERDVKVDIRIKPNDDTSLPASHLVEIKYEFPENFSAGDIVNVPGLVMKPTEEARGDALIGASVKVSPGFFWIALSSLPNEQQRNLALLRERGWIDIPMLYENGKRGILTLEKGTAGADAVEKAVAAWQAG
ncbi:hypothetical protein [Roseibium sp.]|uniref:hypothetical protein n=1 Tax=Roseibium sp. TaxID=1936156 RepID=UPI003B51E3CA